MHKFFVNKENIQGKKAVIDNEDVRHIYKVLRLEAGEKVSINNCEGKEFVGEIISVSKTEVIINILEEVNLNNESNLEVILYQGLPKSSKMDLIVQKATELGITEITPIITKRVVVKTELGEFNKTGRWRKIALEACKQCKRSVIPTINIPIEFDEMIASLAKVDLIVVPYENQQGYGIKNLIKELNREVKTVAIVVGPEGGFEEVEIEILKKNMAKIVTLGPRILRTESAGFVCASLLQYELGDLGGII